MATLWARSGNVYLGNVQIKGVVFVNQAVFKLVKQPCRCGRNFGAHCLKPFPSAS